jgi:hypothetical protein
VGEEHHLLRDALFSDGWWSNQIYAQNVYEVTTPRQMLDVKHWKRWSGLGSGALVIITGRGDHDSAHPLSSLDI